MFIINKIQKWMDTMAGQTFMQYAYSWGAAIVILGTLFKLTHLPGANIMLFVGMGTEVIVFLFSAFERPFDVDEENGLNVNTASGAAGQPIIINGPIMAGDTPAAQESAVATEGNVPANGPVVIGGGGTMPMVAPANIDEMDKATEEYVEKVRELTEAIQRISKQTEALGRNMQEMDTLSRNLTGMNAVYEIQLRGASTQLDAVSQVNEQTKKMAQQIEELNNLYARMIEAMTSRIDRPQI